MLLTLTISLTFLKIFLIFKYMENNQLKNRKLLGFLILFLIYLIFSFLPIIIINFLKPNLKKTLTKTNNYKHKMFQI